MYAKISFYDKAASILFSSQGCITVQLRRDVFHKIRKNRQGKSILSKVFLKHCSNLMGPWSES